MLIEIRQKIQTHGDIALTAKFILLLKQHMIFFERNMQFLEDQKMLYQKMLYEKKHIFVQN